DRKRAHAAGRLAFELAQLVHGEQQPALPIDLEKGWVRRFGSHAERYECDVLRDVEIVRLQPEEINACALRSGVGADVHPCGKRHRVLCSVIAPTWSAHPTSAPPGCRLLSRTPRRTAAAAGLFSGPYPYM